MTIIKTNEKTIWESVKWKSLFKIKVLFLHMIVIFFYIMQSTLKLYLSFDIILKPTSYVQID